MITELVPGKLYRATGPFIISSSGSGSSTVRGFGVSDGIVMAVTEDSFLHEERVWVVRGLDPQGIPYSARLELAEKTK